MRWQRDVNEINKNIQRPAIQSSRIKVFGRVEHESNFTFANRATRPAAETDPMCRRNDRKSHDAFT